MCMLTHIFCVYIYHTAAAQHDQESANGAGRSDHPGETNEQDNAENVLDARQEDTDQGTYGKTTNNH